MSPTLAWSMVCSFLLSFAVLAKPTTAPHTAEVFYNTTTYGLASGHAWSTDDQRLLMHSDRSGVFNLAALPTNGAEPTALTTSATDALYAVSWFPQDDRVLVRGDQGGNEMFHLYVREPSGELRDLTPGAETIADFVGWSADRRFFYVLSNVRDPKGFDVYRYSAADYRPELLFRNDASWEISDVSADGRFIALMERHTSADADIHLVDLQAPAPTPKLITRHSGVISHAVFQFSPDSRSLYYSTDAHGEFRQAWVYDVLSGESSRVIADKWDVTQLRFSESGRYRVSATNADARTVVKVFDTVRRRDVALSKLPPGNLSSLSFSRDERRLALMVGSDTSPNDIYVVDLQSGNTQRLTRALPAAIAETELVASEVIRYRSFDGLAIPALLYKPRQATPTQRVPAVIWVHGGPGGQSRVGYTSLIQHLVHNGYAVLAVNNRGSSGYGKTFYHADDRRHGDVDLQDVVAGKDYLASLKWVDDERIGIMGHSYGGYMVGAALAFSPRTFAVGIDIFGVMNWTRTLNSVPPSAEYYKQSLYDELGDPATDAERHRRISPLFHAKNIAVPLLVVQGANDARVLQVESDEIVAAVRANGVPVEYLLFPDEGHGFTKRVNNIRASDAYLAFLDRHLKGQRSSSVDSVSIDVPYTKQVLANGLTLLVHEDRRVPQVAVNVMYNVGSKDEPAGRSGLAHLFEHLMFGGSEHHRAEWTPKLQSLGASRIDAATSEDSTTFYEKVPSGALDSVLWLESDRMGHLLGALDQTQLDKERGVVQNEKRQRENRPHGLVYDRIARAVWPAGHPYAHTATGSMDDLNAATLEDAHEWFRTWYGPSNAVLVLAGDITPALAKEKVEHYFGALASGPGVSRVTEWIAPRRGVQREVIFDGRLGAARLTRVWNIPGMGTADADHLELLASVMADRQILEAPVGRRERSARLYRRLVTEEGLATNVAVYVWKGLIAGTFTISIDTSPGADLERVERVLDEELQRLLKEGPRAEELTAIRAAATAEMVQSLQGNAYKAWFLARHQQLLGEAGRWKESYARLQSAQPAEIMASGQRWLRDGDYILHTLPRGKLSSAAQDVDRRHIPQPVVSAPAKAPALERTALSNGLQVIFMARHDVPEVTFQMMFPFGDPASGPPNHALLGRMLAGLSTQGAGARDEQQLSEALGLLGASVAASAEGGFLQVSSTALTPAWRDALGMFADVIQRPRLDPADLKRWQAHEQKLFEATASDPSAAAQRLGARLLWGADDPRGRLLSTQDIAALSTDDLRDFHQRWVVPSGATLIVVGDTTLNELRPQLERVFTGWRGNSPETVVNALKPRAATPAVWLIDVPGAQQSDIQLLLPAAPHAREAEVPTQLAMSILGESSISRLDLNLRENKHWTYMVRNSLSTDPGPRVFRVLAPVQTDQTAPAMLEISKELRDIVSRRPVTTAEFEAVRLQKSSSSGAVWETNQSSVEMLSDAVRYSLSDEFVRTHAQRVSEVSLDDVRRAAAELLSDRPFTWVVAGDLAKIEPLIRALKLGPVKIIDAQGRVL
ncbi:alpha/beta fold hydrolase [Steroidobacter sp.]|uniref:alpha/beta fold hydrolase n=1 Tax=Steroidobacter sp. TaxID=1978227 RepID=UPI001A60FD1A|nr:alpha/beta fold hydrolase [Steroidobacter sp.]MBL8271250.1 alpha/beta fold hydrolase [Steroidobacter sp.]